MDAVLFSFVYTSTPSRVSRVVSSAHLRLLAPCITLLLSQWMMHWWRVNGSTAREMFLAPAHQRRARGWTGRKYRCSNVRYDQTRIRNQPTSFCGACSTNIILRKAPTVTSKNSGYQAVCVWAVHLYQTQEVAQQLQPQHENPSFKWHPFINTQTANWELTNIPT